MGVSILRVDYSGIPVLVPTRRWIPNSKEAVELTRGYQIEGGSVESARWRRESPAPRIRADGREERDVTQVLQKPNA